MKLARIYGHVLALDLIEHITPAAFTTWCPSPVEGRRGTVAQGTEASFDVHYVGGSVVRVERRFYWLNVDKDKHEKYKALARAALFDRNLTVMERAKAKIDAKNTARDLMRAVVDIVEADRAQLITLWQTIDPPTITTHEIGSIS